MSTGIILLYISILLLVGAIVETDRKIYRIAKKFDYDMDNFRHQYEQYMVDLKGADIKKIEKREK